MRRLLAALLVLMACAAHAEEKFYGVLLNGQDTHLTGIFTACGKDDADLCAPPADWTAFGIVLTSDEQARTTLAASALGLQPLLNPLTQQLNLRCPAERLPVQRFQRQRMTVGTLNAMPRGVLLNYDIATSWTPGDRPAISVGHEVRFGLAGGVFSSTGQLNVTDGLSYRRGLTRWQRDFVGAGTVLQLGDIFTTGAGWTRTTPLQGVRFASDTALDPRNPWPVPVIGGIAQTQSTLDLYLDRMRWSRRDVNPGPYELDDLPLLNGASTLDLVLRDAFGREQKVSTPIYMTPLLLRPGLTTWDANVGRVRSSVGSQPLAASAHVAHGVSPHLTLDAHAEAVAGSHNLGVGARVLLGRQGGVLTVGVAQSTSPQGQGRAVQVDYAYQGPRWGITAGRTQRSDTWWSLSQEVGPDASDARSTTHLGVTWRSLEKAISATVQAVDVVETDRRTRRLDAQLRWDRGASSWGVGLQQDFERHDSGVMVSYRRNLGPHTTGGIDLFHQHGENGATLRASGTEGVMGRNVHWSAQATASDRDTYGTLRAGWQTPHGDIDLSLDHAGGSTRLAGSWVGGLWIGQGGVKSFRSQSDSWAVVQVPGQAGIPVSVENRFAGVTDRDGNLVVGPLNSLTQNRITLDSTKLPFDVQLDTTEQFAVPARRAGALVVFPIRAQSARAFDVTADGSPAPTGAVVTTAKETTAVGYDGSLYLEQPEAGQVVTITLDEGTTCSVVLPTPLFGADETPTLGCK